MEAAEGPITGAGRSVITGIAVRLIPPAYVKPFVKRQKNDAADAEAICEAAQRPTMRFVAVKSEAAQGAAVVFRTRDMLVRQRTQIINALRGHLAEFGLIVAQGPAHVAKLIMAVQDPKQPLSEAARPILCVLVDMLGLLDQRIKRPGHRNCSARQRRRSSASPHDASPGWVQ